MKKTFLAFISSIVFISCGDATSNDNKEESQDKNKAENSDAEKVTTSESSCLFNYADKFDEIFTIEMISEIIGYNKDDAKSKYSKSTKNVTYHSYTHSWKGSRMQTMEVGTTKVDVPMNDYVSLSGMSKISAEDFDFQYKNLSDEEKAEINKVLEEKVAEKELTEEQNSAASDVSNSIIGSIFYEDVENVGTKSLWNPNHNELIVFHVDMLFKVSVNISNDNNTNKEKAVVIAQALLDLCK